MPKTALLLIDIQNDYFSGGKFPLNGMEIAAKQAAMLLSKFRETNSALIHVRHENPTDEAPFFTQNSVGAQHHPTAAPKDGETIIVKQFPNSFRDTKLKEVLDRDGIDSLIIVGAMSNMCIDAVTRAAHDLGYNCTVAHDACAAMGLELNGVQVPPEQVHAAFMAALGLGYANVTDTDTIINSL
mgnify:CR=1 FL=1|jgi:nicotinamidase-related amidase